MVVEFALNPCSSTSRVGKMHSIEVLSAIAALEALFFIYCIKALTLFNNSRHTLISSRTSYFLATILPICAICFVYFGADDPTQSFDRRNLAPVLWTLTAVLSARTQKFIVDHYEPHDPKETETEMVGV